MCRRVQCDKCDKPTWAGCGMHIETALAGVKIEDRCKCEKGSVFGSLFGSSSKAAPAK